MDEIKEEGREWYRVGWDGMGWDRIEWCDRIWGWWNFEGFEGGLGVGVFIGGVEFVVGGWVWGDG